MLTMLSDSFRILNILFGINSDTARFIEKAVSGYNSEKGTIADANLILEKIGLSDTVQKLGLSNRSLADMNNLMDGLKDLLRVYTIGNYDSSGHRLEKSDLNKKSKRKLKGEEKWLTKLLSTLAQDLTACLNQNGMLRSGWLQLLHSWYAGQTVSAVPFRTFF